MGGRPEKPLFVPHLATGLADCSLRLHLELPGADEGRGDFPLLLEKSFMGRVIPKTIVNLWPSAIYVIFLDFKESIISGVPRGLVSPWPS